MSDVGIRQFGYLTTMVVTIGLGLTLARVLRVAAAEGRAGCRSRRSGWRGFRVPAQPSPCGLEGGDAEVVEAECMAAWGRCALVSWPRQVPA